jgi:predicted amidohydrolase
LTGQSGLRIAAATAFGGRRGGGEQVRAAAVQLNSTDDKARNLATADRLTRAAAAAGAELVVLPEKFNLLTGEAGMRAGAESLDGPTLAWARDTARELSLDLVAGSIAEWRPGHERVSNTSAHFGPAGNIQAVYRKIHMFDVLIDGVEYRESTTEEPGEEIVLSHAGGVPLGLSVCYDLRFPELYRILAVRGARAIAVPAAFTRPTGIAHWDLLVRARAVENQAFVVAAGQVGRWLAGRESFGSSMIVDPWGEVLARAPDVRSGVEETFVCADLDLARQDEVRERLPSLAGRVEDAYRWPTGAQV